MQPNKLQISYSKKRNLSKKKELKKQRYTILFEDESFTSKILLLRSKDENIDNNIKIESTCTPVNSFATSKNYFATSPLEAMKAFNKEYPDAKFISCYTS